MCDKEASPKLLPDPLTPLRAVRCTLETPLMGHTARYTMQHLRAPLFTLVAGLLCYQRFPRDLDSNNLVTVPEGLFGNLEKLENL